MKAIKLSFFILILLMSKTCIISKFLLQVTFHRSPVQVTVLPINKQAKQCPLTLNRAKTSPSMPGDTVQCVYMSATQ